LILYQYVLQWGERHLGLSPMQPMPLIVGVAVRYRFWALDWLLPKRRESTYTPLSFTPRCRRFPYSETFSQLLESRLDLI